MKKKALWSLFLTLTMGLFVFNSCTSKDDVPQENEMASVSFEFDANILVSKSKAVDPGTVPVSNPTECADLNIPKSVQIVVKNNSGVATTINMPLALFNGKYKTNPYELPAGTYTVMSAIVYNTAIPSQIIYSGVKSPSTFAPFIPNGYLMESQTFTVLKYTKPTIPVYVLCVKDHNATDFGMPKFEVNRIEVTCFDLFFNVCDEYKEHFVGAGTIKVWTDVNGQPGAVLYSDTFGDGDIATVCFANNIEISNDASEKYIIQVVFTNYPAYNFTQPLTVAQLLQFKQWTNWVSTMNAVHVELCDPRGTKGIFFGLKQNGQ